MSEGEHEWVGGGEAVKNGRSKLMGGSVEGDEEEDNKGQNTIGNTDEENKKNNNVGHIISFHD